MNYNSYFYKWKFKNYVVPLHNSLIYSIIYNSQRDIISNDGSLHSHLLTNQDSKDRNSLKRKHKFNNKTGAKRMKLKDEFLSLEKIDRDKIRGLIKVNLFHFIYIYIF